MVLFTRWVNVLVRPISVPDVTVSRPKTRVLNQTILIFLRIELFKVFAVLVFMKFTPIPSVARLAQFPNAALYHSIALLYRSRFPYFFAN
jgi:hypothetical protein